jgi:hypothetical protein
MTDDNVIPLRDGAPSLADIPAMLRRMADDIDAGKHEDVTNLVVLMRDGVKYPRVFEWGEVDPGAIVVQLELAKLWLLQNMTGRG